MGAKTPVSVLQEMMTRLGSIPKYDLIYDGSGTHSTLFKYKVYAKNVTAIGSGRSKKEAKHEAARIALDRLEANEIEDVHPPGIPPERVELMTHYKDKLTENAVGALHDLCVAKELPMPQYELLEEMGAPHDKIFTFVCFVSKQKEMGAGRTKKQAKQLAAFNMMNRLKESLSDVLKDTAEEVSVPPRSGPSDHMSAAIAKYISKVGTHHKKIRLNIRPHKGSYFSQISEEDRERALKIISEIEIPEGKIYSEIVDTDWISYVDRILEVFDVERKIIFGRSRQGKNNLFLYLNLSSDAVFCGSDFSPEKAIQHAAYNALVFLKTMLLKEKIMS